MMNRRMVKTPVIAGFLALALAAIVLYPGSSEAVATVGADAAATFKAKCAACHAADGSGGSPMGKKLAVRDLRSAEVQKQTDAQLAAIISKGKGKMPPSKGLSADQVNQLVAYIRTLKK
jgi:mono/diheme cytochrome c family protein